MKTARSNVVSLCAERRRRARASVRPTSVTVHAADLASIMSPRCLQQIAMELDTEHELEFTPRATLIDRLRFTHSVEEFVEIVNITLEKVS